MKPIQPMGVAKNAGVTVCQKATNKMSVNGLENQIIVIDHLPIRYEDYQRHFVGCLVITQSGQLLLQKRDNHCERFPGMLATFGGQIDPGETAEQGLIRELHEELGAQVSRDDLLALGAITKTGLDKALIHAYCWQDNKDSITGCYEGSPAFFNSAIEILKQPSLTADAHWIVIECVKRQLIP